MSTTSKSTGWKRRTIPLWSTSWCPPNKQFSTQPLDHTGPDIYPTVARDRFLPAVHSDSESRLRSVPAPGLPGRFRKGSARPLSGVGPDSASTEEENSASADVAGFAENY